MSGLRIKSIDSFRVIAIFFVVVHHANPFEYSYQFYGHSIFKFLEDMVQSVRFSVPFFFMTSGFLFGKKAGSSGVVSVLARKHIGRLSLLFVAWSLFYLLSIPSFLESSFTHDPFRAFYWFLKNNYASIPDFLFTGTKYHLWFFPGLISAFFFLSAFIGFNKKGGIVPFGLFLYLISLLGKAYSQTPLGFQIDWFDMRSGPFVSMLFVSLGWWFSQRKNISLRMALTLLCAGFVMQIFEAWILRHIWGVPFGSQYLLGTIPQSLGMFSLLLRFPNFGANAWLDTIGKMTLGVYAAHVFVVEGLKDYQSHYPPMLWDFFFPSVVFVLSLLMVIFGRRIPYVKWMVG